MNSERQEEIMDPNSKMSSRVEWKASRVILESVHVPHWMLPHLILSDRITLLLAKDMDNKLHEGRNQCRWLNICNHRKRQWNDLDTVVLPQNPLWQLTAHPVFVGHDPSEVLTYVLNKRHVSSILVRPSDDIMMFHQINCGYVVSRISKVPERFPSTH